MGGVGGASFHQSSEQRKHIFFYRGTNVTGEAAGEAVGIIHELFVRSTPADVRDRVVRAAAESCSYKY